MKNDWFKTILQLIVLLLKGLEAALAIYLFYYFITTVVPMVM